MWQHRVFLAVAAAFLVVCAVAVRAGFVPQDRVRRAMARVQLEMTRNSDAHPVREEKGDGHAAPSGEERCRAFVERVTGIRFRKVRPSWLRNPRTGMPLELDMYTDTPRPIAFEFDGSQHAQYTPFFHASVADFETARERDRVKEKLCLAHGVELVRIPSTVHGVAEAFVYDHLVRMGLLPVPKSAEFSPPTNHEATAIATGGGGGGWRSDGTSSNT